MQTVVTIEFNGRLHRIQAATSEIAIAGLRDEYAKDSGANPSTLGVHCVKGIHEYPGWDQFKAQFNPVRNHIDTNASFGGHMFQTYCEERRFVHAQLGEYVWTIAEDCTEDLIWIRPGFYWVNCLGYIITAYPWKEGQTKYLV